MGVAEHNPMPTRRWRDTKKLPRFWCRWPLYFRHHADIGVCPYRRKGMLRCGGIEVNAPGFPIFLRHCDDVRTPDHAEGSDESLADGAKHSGFRNIQKSAQFARAQERQIVAGARKLDRHTHSCPCQRPDQQQNALRSQNPASSFLNCRDGWISAFRIGDCAAIPSENALTSPSC